MIWNKFAGWSKPIHPGFALSFRSLVSSKILGNGDEAKTKKAQEEGIGVSGAEKSGRRL